MDLQSFQAAADGKLSTVAKSNMSRQSARSVPAAFGCGDGAGRGKGPHIALACETCSPMGQAHGGLSTYVGSVFKIDRYHPMSDVTRILSRIEQGELVDVDKIQQWDSLLQERSGVGGSGV